MSEYDEHFITTYTGKRFHYLDPQPEEIDIRDIAHALSLTCRFGGHCREFYSVAQHSVHAAELAEYPWKLSVLMHDAHEAYLHDVPRPIKKDIKGYAEIANKIQGEIEKVFPLAISLDPETKLEYIDNIMLSTEARDLLTNTYGWSRLPRPLLQRIIPWEAKDAEQSFLTAFRIYGGRV